jgi:hypothetical protein
VPSTHPFVLSKSGIGYQALDAGAYDRRILTAQLVEYGTDDTGHAVPVEVRCKMRSRESLNRPESEKQRFDGGATSPTPWGFGPGTATGTPKTCLQVQSDDAAAVWNSLTQAQKDAAPFRLQASAAGPANVDIASEILPEGISASNAFGAVTPETNSFISGTQWVTGYKGPGNGYQPGDGFDTVRVKAGRLEIRSATLEALSSTPNPIGDRLTGAYYCSFSTPEYLRDVFTGVATPPAAVS